MINILFPAVSNSIFFENYYFPKLLVEVKGKTMLELATENYRKINDAQILFLLNEHECNKFHLDRSVKSLLNSNGDVIVLNNDTEGALCTCLMAVEKINNDEPLIIANYDQIIDVDYDQIMQYFQYENADAGVITFHSIHPRWSFIREFDGEIIEVAEKKPISDQAIAGFYYFKSGRLFVEAAENAIRKGATVNQAFYLSASINELIIQGKKISHFSIENSQYHSFYSPEKIREYEEGKAL